MAQEIERKFLVSDQNWREGAKGVPYRQGYLTSQPGRTVRVRVAGDQGWLTIKGPSEGVSRAEYEYPVPVADALEMLDTLCERPQIEKTRYLVPFAGNTWEVDEFHGDNEGLVVAELELDSADQRFESPPWLGREVSDDVRYFNSHLARHPYSRWKNA